MWRLLRRVDRRLWLLLFLALALPFVLIYPLRPPPDQQALYLVGPGRVSRMLVLDQHGGGRLNFLPFLPRYVAFDAAGPVDIVVLHMGAWSQADSIRKMLEVSDTFAQGNDPGPTLAASYGEASGRLHLHTWPRGKAKYLVLLRADRETEVAVRVSYGG